MCGLRKASLPSRYQSNRALRGRLHTASTVYTSTTNCVIQVPDIKHTIQLFVESIPLFYLLDYICYYISQNDRYDNYSVVIFQKICVVLYKARQLNYIVSRVLVCSIGLQDCNPPLQKLGRASISGIVCVHAGNLKMAATW